MVTDNQRIIIVSPFYNVGESIIHCIESLRRQNFLDFEAYFIDDISTDNTLEYYRSAVDGDSRFNLIINTEKKYAIRNISDCLNSLGLEENDIILQIDGDDYLYDEFSIQKIIDYYNRYNCWVTYGSYINKSDGIRGLCASEIPDEIILSNQIRKYPWVTSHLKTFKYGIFKRIEIEDFKDESGEWLKTTHDLALMYPLIEMAGERSLYVPDVVYVYNDANDINDEKVNNTKVNEITEYLKNKLPYTRINYMSETKKPRIKICHLLLDPNQPQDIHPERWSSTMNKQKASIAAFEKISSNFACYSQMYSVVNRTDLPSENCAQPEIINASKEFANVPPVLSYGHYGAYVAHRSAIEDFGNYDAILVIESDVVYDVSPEEMVKEIYDAYEFGVQRSGAMFTLGAVSYGTASRASVNDTAIYMGKYKQVDHFLCAHCYMVFGSEKESIQNKLKNSGWHAWDIWIYWNYDTRVPIFATTKPLVHEPSGYSVIDYEEKKL
jgi:glycosyltransferase involved in cell wall biosynthesis